MQEDGNHLIFLLMLSSIVVFSGCIDNGETPANQTNIATNTTQTPNLTQTTNMTASQTTNQTANTTKTNVTKTTGITGPGNCSNDTDCEKYCAKSMFECTAWCSVNSGKCSNLSIKIGPASGVPGSPCTTDKDCYQSLICLDFKCDIPSPGNLAKKPGFSLPGNCKSLTECAGYCAKPGNVLDCLRFCESFPSLCNIEAHATEVPQECQSCLKCNSKECILDCVYTCYAYMPVEKPDIAALKKDVVFGRKYQMPIKAVV
jgi:hypothetical protein